MQEIRIRFAPWMGILMIVVGVFNVFVFALTGNQMQLVLGAMFGLFGVLQLFGTAIVVSGNEVQMKNALGMTLKRHPFESMDELSITDKKLYVSGKKVAGLGFHLSGADVDKLRSALHTAPSQ